ncbi:unnamed protein product [Acanthoscelides obtectus]|uniref:Uncharacterized protein n=1 Tax=Acanthoscelides obtectus TaxID=200917 RepID=A0A9P0JTB1_ACAOB|nr:unnamed protein product [Acanthoscelides obtectus]CAK1679065.1 hypothetical protein AOBTE_LOCUS32110 [Acanthoscelides obtectus]
MSSETNGNPPTATKRKKNRDKQSLSNSNGFDLSFSNCSNFPFNSTAYLTVPEMSTHYASCLNYTNPTEPISLPVYPLNCHPKYNCPPHHVNWMKGSSKHMTMPNFSQANGDNEYLSLPVGNVDPTDDTCKRSFSDPGLPDESDSGSSFDDCIVQKLTQQVNSLKESNKRLTKEVMELKVEVNMLKQQQSYRHYDRDYEPGMVADIIREVRDAARVREDALLARVKHLIEEKQLGLIVSNKNKNSERISKLEEQMKHLNINNQRSEDINSHFSNITSATEESINSSTKQVLDLEKEALELRKELQNAKAKKEESDKKISQYVYILL